MEKHRIMIFVLVELCIVVTLGYGAPVQANTLTKADAIEYLKRYNYISKTVSTTSVPPKTLSQAVSMFQEMANLKVTGELNNETLSSMTQTRCGFQDNNKKGSDNYVAVEPWPKKKLSWKIQKYATTKKLTQTEQRDAMARALDLWANKTKLKFNYVESQSGSADININFFAGAHGDGYPFDGPLGVLAHADLPTGGTVHFDDKENWFLNTKGQTTGIELFIVAAHEFGHTLGLDHTNVRGALMYPFYSYSPNLALHQDDIKGIQSLYGKRGKPKNPGNPGKRA